MIDLLGRTRIRIETNTDPEHWPLQISIPTKVVHILEEVSINIWIMMVIAD